MRTFEKDIQAIQSGVKRNTETKGKGFELVGPGLERHPHEPPGLGMYGNVEISILQSDAVCPHFLEVELLLLTPS